MVECEWLLEASYPIEKNFVFWLNQTYLGLVRSFSVFKMKYLNIKISSKFEPIVSQWSGAELMYDIKEEECLDQITEQKSWIYLKFNHLDFSNIFFLLIEIFKFWSLQNHKWDPRNTLNSNKSFCVFW